MGVAGNSKGRGHRRRPDGSQETLSAYSAQQSGRLRKSWAYPTCLCARLITLQTDSASTPVAQFIDQGFRYDIAGSFGYRASQKADPVFGDGNTQVM